jgi:hypothetical protein
MGNGITISSSFWLGAFFKSFRFVVGGFSEKQTVYQSSFAAY